MEQKLYELLKPWAGISTWHTTHPMDRDRFNAVMHSIVSKYGGNVDIEAFQRALRQHAENNPAVLGNPEHWDKVIDKYTLLAESIFEYENAR
ncbi:hypothetical protein I6M49_22065 [Shewanella algae]|uniref:hypothetical protein n=1 Tax=Shewanella algae TaxID=38313 RepID=UPI001AAD11F0|nr:hypothetical protein [Shewanella algae]MBO2656131.1 hypothetical protein [Shewanella algae]